jgi:hypothetical protein
MKPRGKVKKDDLISFAFAKKPAFSKKGRPAAPRFSKARQKPVWTGARTGELWTSGVKHGNETSRQGQEGWPNLLCRCKKNRFFSKIGRCAAPRVSKARQSFQNPRLRALKRKIKKKTNGNDDFGFLEAKRRAKAAPREASRP